jgi:hypothetical protein
LRIFPNLPIDGITIAQGYGVTGRLFVTFLCAPDRQCTKGTPKTTGMNALPMTTLIISNMTLASRRTARV